MFEGYVERLLLMALIFFGLLIGVQLLVYWLIDKFTPLNFPIAYRIGLTILVTIGYLWYRN